MSLFSKTRDLVEDLYNDFNKFFDNDEMIAVAVPAYQMDGVTAMKIEEMEKALQGKDNNTRMSGVIFSIKNGQPEPIPVHTVGEAWAVINKVKAGELGLA